jgi:hypothetical protein
MVVLGTPTADSSKLFAITVTEGDPTWAGPLAGEALGLPVFHITEPEIKEQVDESLYEEEVGLVEMVLETDEIIEAVKQVRNGAGAA